MSALLKVLATNTITNGSGTLLASGTISFVATDTADNPIPIGIPADGATPSRQAIPSLILRTVTAGSIDGGDLYLANPAVTSPANIFYRVVITDLILGTVATYRNVQVVDAGDGTWNFASWNTGLSLSSVPMTFVVGPTGAQGPSGVVSGVQVANAATRNLSGNVFNPATVLMDYVLSKAGSLIAIVNDPRFFVSDFITVRPGGWLVCNLHMPSSASGYPPLGGCFYDILDNYISGFDGVDAGTGVAVPANAVSVRFPSDAGGAGGANIVNCKVYLSETLPTAITNPAITAATIAGSLAVNLFDPSAMTFLNLLIAADGTLYGINDGNYGVTDFFPLRAGGTVSCNYPVYGAVPGYPAFGWAFYDNNKTFVGGVVGGGPVRTAVAVPPNAVYGRCCFDQRSVSLALTVIMRDVTIPAYYVYPGMTAAASLDIASTVKGPAAGKKALTIGNSITAAYSSVWLPRVFAATGMVQVGQDARSGRSTRGFNDAFTGPNGTYNPAATSGVPNIWADGVSRWAWDSTKNQAQNIAAIAPDIILVELGTNDGNTPAGSVGDATTAGTLAGDVRNVIETLLTAAPAARLLWIGPYRAYNADPYPAQAAIIQTVCAHYAVPYLDLYNTSGINALTLSNYLLLDPGNFYVHPNATGGAMLARRVSASINQQF